MGYAVDVQRPRLRGGDITRGSIAPIQNLQHGTLRWPGTINANAQVGTYVPWRHEWPNEFYMPFLTQELRDPDNTLFRIGVASRALGSMQISIKNPTGAERQAPGTIHYAGLLYP